jgi:hypothetical protein
MSGIQIKIDKKISKVKKNINIFKKDKTVKIKLSNVNTQKKKSMEDAIKQNEVLLWGLNRVDSILLGIYENNNNQNFEKIIKLKNKFDNENKFTNMTNELNNLNIPNNKFKIEKTTDTEYIPENTYNICDLEFLNMEYDKIEKKINQMIDLTDEYDNLLDIQDNLNTLINELDIKSKENDIKSKENDIKSKENDKHEEFQIQIKNTNNTINNLIEEEIDKQTKSIKLNKIKSNKTKSTKSPKKPKPYYWIGKIPEGYREATEEEAIINKKVSLYGKKRVQRELYSLFEITCTIYMELEDLVELNKQILALKGKLKYYKKEIEYYKITLDSDTISDDTADKIKNKISEMKNYYKKTLDIYNLYVKQYNKVKNNCNQIQKS